VLNEIQAAQQSWAGQGLVVAPATVSILRNGDVLFTYVDAGKDMEAVSEVRAVEGTLGGGVWLRCARARGGGGGGVTRCLCGHQHHLVITATQAYRCLTISRRPV
jgi:hypothetical protein